MQHAFAELRSRHLMEISIELHPIQMMGSTSAGERRVIPVSGGALAESV
jgi:hypothetical protein